jgi:hypothetical protein
VDPRACLYVGNSPGDEQAASNAGMQFGLVDARTGPLDALRNALTGRSGGV